MPSCTPETTRCKSLTSTSTTRARVFPLATSCRTRDNLTATSENSVAAKKPFSATNARTPIRRTAIILGTCPPQPHCNSTAVGHRSEEHTSELQSQSNLVCRLLLEKKKQHTSEAVLIGLRARSVETLHNNTYLRTYGVNSHSVTFYCRACQSLIVWCESYDGRLNT